MDEVRELDMPIKRHFFDQILNGTKTEEFRKRTKYWKVRLEDREYDLVRFRAGYDEKSPRMWVEFKGVKDSPDGNYAIQLGKIVRTKHCRIPGSSVFERAVSFIKRKTGKS